ncbi:MAG: PEPxxWA-CTERM sorting domain-containing protein [Sphingomonas sp.]|nr:PEPxxWA-CTERM sorting domain-containing protein [Sphingomonas sp.]
MTSTIVARALALGALMFASAQGQAANLLTNGGFEQPDIGGYLFLNPGSTTITGWTVGAQAGSAAGTQVQFTDNSAFASYGVVGSEGGQFLDLTGGVGRGGGVVSDGFATLAGVQYSVAFDLGAFFVRNAGSYGDATVDLFIDGALVQSFTNVMSLSGVGSDWERKVYSFTGTGAAMTIGLYSSLSTSSSNLGVGLDNVVVEQLATPPVSSAVPEPASWALMIAGLGAVGVSMRRRRTALAFS